MKSRTYLFVTFEGGGNVPAVLGAARRLIERGHEVRVLTEPCLRSAVEEIGGRFVPFREHFVRSDRTEPLFEDWKAKSPPGALGVTIDRVILGPAVATASGVADALDEANVDVLVVDWMLPAAIAVGEARGIPTAVLFHCPNLLPGPGRPAGPMAPARGPLGRVRDRIMWALFNRLVDSYRGGLDQVRESLGLDPLERAFDQYQRADRILVQTSEAFDFTGDPDPDNLVYVGPILDDPDWAESSWDNPWPAEDRRPLVVVSLSTTFQNQRHLLGTVIEGLGSLDVRGLVTLGPAIAGARFDAPGNVKVVASAPHGLVFPHADAFVTHCGHGSIVRALAHGVPMVAVPMGRDQDGNATRIVQRGIGLRPRKTARSIANAVRRVLEEPSFRDAAGTLRAQVLADVEENRLIGELESLAGQHPAGYAVGA